MPTDHVQPALQVRVLARYPGLDEERSLLREDSLEQLPEEASQQRVVDGTPSDIDTDIHCAAADEDKLSSQAGGLSHADLTQPVLQKPNAMQVAVKVQFGLEEGARDAHSLAVGGVKVAAPAAGKVRPILEEDGILQFVDEVRLELEEDALRSADDEVQPDLGDCLALGPDEERATLGEDPVGPAAAETRRTPEQSSVPVTSVTDENAASSEGGLGTPCLLSVGNDTTSYGRVFLAARSSESSAHTPSDGIAFVQPIPDTGATAMGHPLDALLHGFQRKVHASLCRDDSSTDGTASV